MNTTMRIAQTQLIELLETNPRTQGTYVRIHGDHLIIGRQEPFAAGGGLVDDDRLRLTRLNASSFGFCATGGLKVYRYGR